MKVPITLRVRLVMLMVAAILPLFALSMVTAWLNANAAISRTTDNLKFAASLVAANQERLVDASRQILLSMVHAPGLAGGHGPDCGRFLQTMREELPIYANLGIVGLDGNFRCDALGSGAAMYGGDRDFFRAALAQRDFVAGAYLMGRAAGKPVVGFAMPVMNDKKQVTAVAFATVDLKALSTVLADSSLALRRRLVITDRQGIVLAATPSNPALIGQAVPSPLLQEAVKTMHSGVAEGSDGNGQPRIFAFLPAGKLKEAPFFIAVSADRDEVLAPALQQLGRELLLLTLVAFAGGWLAWLMGGRVIVKPTREILAATRQIQRGQLDARIPIGALKGKEEFARIADGFNLMADSLQQRESALELELQRSLQAYSALELTVNSMHEGMIAVDAVGRSLLINEPAKEILSIDENTRVLSSDWIGQQGFFAPDTCTPLAEDELPLNRALKGGHGLLLTFMRNAATPQGRLLCCRYHPMRQDEDIVGALCVFSDVTEMERLQLEQAETQRRLLDAQRLGRIGVWEQNLQTQALWASDEIFNLYGVTRDSLDGHLERLWDQVHPDDREDYLRQHSVAAATGQPAELECRIITATGEVRWMHQYDSLQTDCEGRTLYRTGVVQDITRRKLAEQALIESEQRYAALFDTAPLPMLVYDALTRRFLTVNRAALLSYGYTLEDFRSMTLFDVLPEADRGRLRKQLSKPVEGKRGRWRHCRKDGLVFPVDVMSHSIQYAGRAARFVVVVDVSAQVKAEKEVQDYLFTLQRAADATQAITWHQTLEGSMQEIAEQARGVIGTHLAMVSFASDGDWAQAINALSLSEKYAGERERIAPPDGRGLDALVCEKNRSMRLTRTEIEAHPRWRDGEAGKSFAMRGWLAIPLMGRTGKNIGLLQLSDKYEGEFTQQDEYVAMELAQLAAIAIENSRLLQEVSRLNAGLEQTVSERTVALARQEALFRALAEQAPEVIWTIKPNGAVTYFNRAWFDLVGGVLEDWIGNQWYGAIHPEDLAGVQENWRLAKANQSLFTGIRRVRAKDGSHHTMSYRASPVLDDQGEVVFWVGIDTDITEIKTIEAALRLSNQELEAFSYSVSHDLRSPLNTIDGFSRLLAKQVDGHSGEKVAHYLSRIQAGVAQMGQLIEDLLSLAQVSRAPLRNEPVNLSALARGILDECLAHHPERQVVLHIESGLQAHGDGRLIRVVMENLLKNAWKFTSRQVLAEIRVGQQTDAAGLPVFFVRDNGAGFDMAYADKLFNPFQRLHAVSEFPGTGIGLATVSRVIRRHGGRLWAEAAPGMGASFFFTLPRAAVSA
ncbi:PAS domain S-box-containing protein [Polaromonas sp. OV174]|uniref:PAS domain S-box protein n=1 Tax=Polaromonas sp. OV174 TaxID=1855300 RepID=UPI0008F1057A|nr:PAS domain S-box protein [Polaromonas sp. OV174]SFB92179.1 PAS domain S-box-containing protein [Polaromonas sp. OV174]